MIVRRKSDGTTINLAYDADGIRIGKTLLNASSQLVSSTSYLVCTNNLTGYAQVMEERITSAAGTTVKAYTYGSDLLSVATQVPGSSLPAPCSFFVYDGGGSVRALTDESGAITDTWDYDAFGNFLGRTGTSDNAYLYRGEHFDADLGQYYLRARFYNQSTGRFWNQDTYEGANDEPVSLHKYLYAHADPMNGIDPSGHMTLTEQLATTQIQGILNTINTGYRVINTINRAKSMIELVIGLRQVLGAIGGELSGKDWKGLVKSADVDLPSPDEAAVTFAELASQAFLQASPSWIAGYTGDLLRGKKIDAYLIYMPTFIPWFKETNISSGLKIGGIPVKLVAGASSVRKVGGLLGIGASVDKRNTQLLRMDYHAFRPGHGGSSGLQKDELAILKQNRYHMHVYRWGHASSGD